MLERFGERSEALGSGSLPIEWWRWLRRAYPHPRVMEVVPGVYQVTTWGVNFFLIVEREGLTLIDCGVRGSAPFLLSFIDSLGRSPRELGWILITHHHYDHTGELVKLWSASGGRVAVHAADVANGLPYPIPEPATRLLRYPPLSSLKRLLVVESRYFDTLLYGGEVLPPLGGLEVVHTPGHTPGSLCFFSPRYRLLVVGDALVHRGGRLGLPRRLASVNPAQARRSLYKLLDLPFEVLCFGHGRPLRARARERLEALLAQP